jgi:hypothetical protein
MKNFSKCFGVIALIAIITLAFAGCGPKVESVSVNGDSGSIKTGDSLQFSAVVTGKNNPSQSVKWTVSSTSDGSGAVANDTDISPSGTLTVADKETASSLYVKAVSTLDSSKFDYKQVKVEVVKANTTAPKATVTAVTVSPANPTLRRRDTETFTVKVTGTNNPNQNVTWKVVRNLDGTGNLDKNTKIEKGALTVDGENGEFYIIATSTVDNKTFGTTKVTIGNRRSTQEAPAATTPAAETPAPAVTTPAPAATDAVAKITISPGTGTRVDKGATQAFTANSAVTWSIEPTEGGVLAAGTKIDANGLLTVAANEDSRRMYVKATSKADNTKSDTIRVNIN